MQKSLEEDECDKSMKFIRMELFLYQIRGVLRDEQ